MFSCSSSAVRVLSPEILGATNFNLLHLSCKDDFALQKLKEKGKDKEGKTKNPLDTLEF